MTLMYQFSFHYSSESSINNKSYYHKILSLFLKLIVSQLENNITNICKFLLLFVFIFLIHKIEERATNCFSAGERTRRFFKFREQDEKDGGRAEMICVLLYHPLLLLRFICKNSYLAIEVFFHNFYSRSFPRQVKTSTLIK